MNRTARRTKHLARASIVLLLAGIPAATLAGPGLAGWFSNPPYAFAARCDLTEPVVFVNLVVTNRGDAPTAPEPVVATDSINGLSGSATLPPLGPGAQGTLRLPLRHGPSNLGGIAGVHAITVTLGAVRLAPLAVTVPPALCATGALGATRLTVPASTQSAVHVREPNPQQATPRPGIGEVAISQSSAARAVLAISKPAVPGNVRVSNGPQECAAHVGLLGALACPDMIRSGNVLLVWNWQPGAGPSEIDGFRV
jgi:hypothetical protein